MKFKRIFVIVADSLGVGYEEESKKYFNDGKSDYGSNTFLHISQSINRKLNIPTLEKLGIKDIVDSNTFNRVEHPNSFICKMNEMSVGKDTMTGHWEMMGVYTTKPFLTFTENGFPKELIQELEIKTGHKIIGNKAASGTDIIKELGEEQKRDNSLIVYTSADSVLQIAAHEETTSLEELYRCCEIAREICMKPEWMVGRIIARPFLGNNKQDFHRDAPKRHDLTIKPPYPTAMNILKDNNYTTYCIGKINDIFDGYGVSGFEKTSSNNDGMDKTINVAKQKDFTGICFVNLVEFDSEFGHRRNVEGYAKCIEEFDAKLNELLKVLKDDDLLLITADHGNDPTWSGTDHTREKVPLIAYSKSYKNGGLIEERSSFADIGSTILDNFNLEKTSKLIGKSILVLLK